MSTEKTLKQQSKGAERLEQKYERKPQWPGDESDDPYSLLFTEYWEFGPPSEIPLLFEETWTIPNPPDFSLEFSEAWSS